MCVFIFLFLMVLLQPKPLTITSPDFSDGGEIPMRFTCDGDDINPTLIINGIPEGTKSLALIVEDMDAPLAIFTQWITWNIKPVDTILENTVPGIEGMNSIGKTAYRGPCPTAGFQRYVFKVYALNTMLNLEPESKRSQLLVAMQGHILASGLLTGAYSRAVVLTEKEN